MSVLILADYNENGLCPFVARLVSAAKMLGGDIDILVAGDDVKNIAQQAAKLDGVEKILFVNNIALKNQTAEVMVGILEDIIKPYSHFITNFNASGKDILGRLAAKLDVMPISDVMLIHSPNKFERPIYAGNAIEVVSSAQSKNLLGIRCSAFAPVGKENGAKIEQIDVGEIESMVEFIKAIRTKNDMPDLSMAQIVVAGGQAFESKENFQILHELGNILGAPVGATRAAVDLGFAPNETQIGQSGKIIAPELYIAIGISGALQHLAGITGAKKIIAINSDADAPIMKVADIAFVGDLKIILPQLIKKLSK